MSYLHVAGSRAWGIELVADELSYRAAYIHLVVAVLRHGISVRLNKSPVHVIARELESVMETFILGTTVSGVIDVHSGIGLRVTDQDVSMFHDFTDNMKGAPGQV